MSATNARLTARDFKSGQEVKWCPGCGNYSILAQAQKVLADAGATKENTVFVSGIGCSSRFPYYMDTFGFHGIHGRAPAIATGVKVANPDLDVWVMTGDGDGLSIGGNHLIHTIRRNVGLKIVLFNNRIYGLTKGQYSPTSEFGKKTKSSPWGTIDHPIHPTSIAIGAEVTFVARCVDVDVQFLQTVLRRAAEHQGTAFVEIYQDCNVYNRGAYGFASDRKTKFDNVLYLEHAKPMIFGKEKNKGIRLNGTTPEVVELGKGITVDDLLIHDEKAPEPTLAYLLSRMHFPDFPEPMGVFRAVEAPTYEDLLLNQIEAATEKLGAGKLEDLFSAGDTWTVN
ncbi:MAG: 2-oxoacid:ferredoxin oxidoreductase subunit beta [Phycisphaerae bacterium]